MTGFVGTVGVAMLLSYEGYNKGVNDLAHDMMTSYIWSEVGYISTLYQENDLAAFESYFEGTNLDAEIYLMDGNKIQVIQHLVQVILKLKMENYI